MKRNTACDWALALVALASVLIYILACTSFSPDDKQVLYPTIDPQSGQVGVAVYSRDTGRSELVFVPHLRPGKEILDGPTMLRPQWLPDNQGIMVAWPGAEGTTDNEDGMNVAVLPLTNRGPVQLFRVPDVKDAAALLVFPLSVAGHWLFLPAKSNNVVRLDLITGELKRHEYGRELIPYPSPRLDGASYVAENESGRIGEIGLLNPSTFALTPILQVDTEKGDFSGLHLSPDGGTAAFVIENDNVQQICFKRKGKAEITSPKLNKADERLSMWNGQFSAKGDVFYTAFSSKAQDGTNCAYGFLEVPVSGGTARQTTLIPRGPPMEDEAVFCYQIGVSHDGKTVAVASTYLAFAKESMRADDCALFLVDLSDPQRRVTKVPIPLPPKPKTDEAK